MENEIVEMNIWTGLKKRLPDPEKKALPPKKSWIKQQSKLQQSPL